jgi:IclR family acetate operon transcriptional repressor
MGKALLAFGPDGAGEVAALAPFAARTPHTRTEPEEVEREVDLTRERGWSIDDEENMVGVRCVGAPVLDATGTARWAIAVQGPAARMPRGRFAALGPRVVAAAAEIAEAMPSGTDGTASVA